MRAVIARRALASLAGLIVTGACILLATGPASGRPPRAGAPGSSPPAGAPGSSTCPELAAKRDRANPLGLAKSPGGDPLRGARFYVPGPAHGAAAGAIAQVLRLSAAGFDDSTSWMTFQHNINAGRYGHLSGGRAFQVRELAKIAREPEVQRFSVFSGGGGPGAVFGQAQKILCNNTAADPGTIPLLNTYFLHPAAGACPSPGALAAAGPAFRRRVTELAQAIGRRPAVLLMETDAIGSSSCIKKVGSLPTWESFLRFEIGKLGSLPHVVAYVEGGYSDSNSPQYTARVLNAAGVRRIRGFYTNDTHLNWTINEIRWASKVSSLTHGAHFVVNTAQNGRGPKLNPNPAVQGNEDLCNPPGRGLGPRPTTLTGFKRADAFLFTSPPGNSSGCGGGPPGGVFFPARAIGLASRANQQLGPGFPSRPY